MATLFGDLLPGSTTRRKRSIDDRRGCYPFPPADVLESPKAYTFHFDVPGLCKSDLEVTVEGGRTLVISSKAGERKEEEEKEKCRRYLRLERRACGSFSRRFRLPDIADVRTVTASCDDGVLTVVVGKLPPPETHPPTKAVGVSTSAVA